MPHITQPGGLLSSVQDNLHNTYVYDSGAGSWVPMTQPSGGTGGTASTDDAGFTAGSGSGTPIMGFASSDTVDSGDVGVLAMTTTRQLKVTLYDSTGTEQAPGGGTQYTEDAAAAANPVGNMSMFRRRDTLTAAEVSADGDNIAAVATAKGELYVKHTDAIPVTQSGTWDEIGINDSGNSITIDNATLSVVGGGTEATALRVTLASDSTGVVSVDDNGGSITVDGAVTVTNAGTFATQPTEVRPASATVSNVTASASSTSVLSSNAARRVATFYNDADKSCYVKLGTTASTSSFTVRLFPGGYYTMPFPAYTGAIDAIWESSPTGSLRVTEY